MDNGIDKESKGAMVTGLAALFYAALVHNGSGNSVNNMQAIQGGCFDAAESLVAMAEKRGHLRLKKEGKP